MAQTTYPEAARAGEPGCADTGLVAQLRAGDEAALSELVDQWSPAMLRVARSYVGSVQSAEDVVQEAWLGMLTGLAGFQGRSSLRTWTFSILVNRARTRGAREARTLPHASLGSRAGAAADDWIAGLPGEGSGRWASTGSRPAWDSAPETAALSREVLRLLDDAVSGLPDRQRQVVAMRDMCGMTAEEVCSALGISAPNQRVLLHRARAALRAALGGYYRG
jgi:RNA polymerase sigma-70 factor, ECF subfamily